MGSTAPPRWSRHPPLPSPRLQCRLLRPAGTLLRADGKVKLPIGEGMQPRSCRRQPSPPGGSDREEEDGFSVLPQEMLLEILGRVRRRSVPEAVRTSVLSRRWRGLWTQLHDLRFDGVDPGTLVNVLGQVRPELNSLDIRFSGEVLEPVQISSLLHALNRLAPADLTVALKKRHNTGPFELPFFNRATSIGLDIRMLQFTLPPSGSFASLEELHLTHVWFNIDVLLPHCPCLCSLWLDYGHLYHEINTITVHSKSLQLLHLEFRYIHPGLVVDIVAPELIKKFMYALHTDGGFTVSLLAPKLQQFFLNYTCERWLRPRVGFGNKWILWCLTMETESSNKGGQPLHVRTHVLSMTILTQLRDTPYEQSIVQEVNGLPVTNFSVLKLELRTEGHVFGPLVLQLLSIRTTIQRLKLVLLEDMFKKCPKNSSLFTENRCSENCDCDEASSWRNELICLPDLQVVEIEGFRLTDHEVDFLELLLRSAPMLRKCPLNMAARFYQTMNNGRSSITFLTQMLPWNALLLKSEGSDMESP
ncbi:hypothetical protein ACP4OV_007343 [Aristida adscensionis]